MDLKTELKTLTNINHRYRQSLSLAGFKTIDDLINYFPRRYDDYSTVLPVNKIRPGLVTIKAKINNIKTRYTLRRLHLTEAIASDKSGSVRIIWFNQRFREKSIDRTAQYYISGKFELSAGRFAIQNPNIEKVENFNANTARILAVYRESKVINSRLIRSTLASVKDSFSKIEEILPAWLIKKYDLMPRAKAIEYLHIPPSNEELDMAKRRLGFEEVFQLSLASLLNKEENKTEHARSIKFNEPLAKEFVSKLPFKLTNNQRLIIWQIYQDLIKTEPMNRLIEGDVGSGKTVVAAMAALMVINESMQVAFMAPTEILVRQHYETIKKLLAPVINKEICLLVGSMTQKEKEETYKLIKNGTAGIIIGTHALIQENVDVHNLALVVIDEQHRFGVAQRKALMMKAGHMPHLLSLSATPIPRSLALTLYGELDISILSEKPKARLPIITKIIKASEINRLYDHVTKEIIDGKQVFVVCPNINESEQLDIKAVENIYQEYKEKTFKKYNIGLLHGNLAKDQKNSVMQDFLNKKIDLLVSTTVIEVGVDVPNATIMLILSPERFGLAQLHQLRGRVGRGEHQGYCYLLLDDNKEPSKRLKALTQSNDGFKLSELDLDIRGPGAIYGTMQHGAIDLRVANLSDTKLIKEAVSGAREFIKSGDNLLKYKQLSNNVSKLRTVTNLN